MGVKLENGWQGTLKEIRDALGMTTVEFSKEWRRLSPESQAQIKDAVWSGTMTY